MSEPSLKPLFVGLVVVFAGCGPHAAFEVGSGIEPLAKADGWRDALHAVAPTPFSIIEIAYDAESAHLAWEDNVSDALAAGRPPDSAIYLPLDEIDLETHAIVVWSSGQSGACPGWLAEIQWEDSNVLRVERGEYVRSGHACTADFRAYRMILAVDREKLPPAEALPTEEVTGVTDGLVIRYGEHD